MSGYTRIERDLYDLTGAWVGRVNLDGTETIGGGAGGATAGVTLIGNNALTHAANFNRQNVISDAGATTQTLNNDATSGGVDSDYFELENIGPGTVTVAPGTATLLVGTGFTATIAPNVSGSFVRVAANTWMAATPSGAVATPAVASTAIDSMVVFGDSIAQGFNASVPATGGWAALMAASYGAKLLNQGISGTVLQHSNGVGGTPLAQNGRDRYFTDLRGPNAKTLTVINYGFNDLRYTTAPATMNLANFTSQYKEVLQGLIIDGVPLNRIILGSPYWANTAMYTASADVNFNGSNATIHRTYVQAVSDVAKEYGVRYADNYAAMANGGDATLISGDNVHPNDAGHAVIAESMLLAVPNNPNPLPTGLILVKTSSTSMTLSWAAPSDGPAVTNYSVEYGTRASQAFGQGAATTAALTSVFAGLTNGLYVARVRANLADGTKSPWANYVAPVAIDAFLDTNAAVSDFTVGRTFGASLETLDAWARMGASTGGASASESGVGTVRGPAAATQLSLYRQANLTMPGAGGVFCEAVINVRSQLSGSVLALQLRASDAITDNAFTLYYDTNQTRFIQWVSGSPSVLGTLSAVPFQAGLDYVLRMECGPNLQRAYINGVLLFTGAVADAGWMGTEAGLRFFVGGSVNSDVAGMHVKRFRSGTWA